MSLYEDEKLHRHLQLKLGINRYLARRSGKNYQNQIRLQFSSYRDDEFVTVVEEMIAEGLLIRTTGRLGGTVLQQMVETKKETI